MKKSARIINRLFLIAGIGMLIYFVGLGVGVRFGQSFQWVWALAGGACILRYFICRKLDREGKHLSKPLAYTIRAFFALGIVLFLLIEGAILTGFVEQTTQPLDYIIVLGARVNGREPSGALRNRIDRGIEYLKENPNTRAILSGGQGADEEISEAQCMYERMTAAGIQSERLILEQKSTDTSENLRFSCALIPEADASIGIVTNNFHIFRALGLARGQGIQSIVGIPVATTWASLPHYMVRECIGVLYDGLRGNLALG